LSSSCVLCVPVFPMFFNIHLQTDTPRGSFDVILFIQTLCYK
jgi:hypothetical protein